MPIPSPSMKEENKDFLSRCMSDPKMVSEYSDRSQRYAVCSAQLKKKSSPQFKYLIKIEKAISQNGEVFLQGVASGVDEDADGERMNIKALESFVAAINKSKLPLTDAHPKNGPVLAELGEVIEARITPQNQIYIKAKADTTNPAIPYLVNKIQEGKRFAFSLEGYLKSKKQVWSDKLQKFITEFQDIIPKSISVTTEPAYLPSFVEVVTKAARQLDVEQDEVKSIQELRVIYKSLTGFKPGDKNKLVIIKSSMEEKETTQPEVVETTQPVVTEPEKEVAAEVVEQPTEEVKEEVKEEVDETKEDVEKAGSDSEKIQFVLDVMKSMGYSMSKQEEEKPKEDKKEEMMKSQDVLDVVTKSIDTKVGEVLTAVQTVGDKLTSLETRVDAVEKLPLAKKSKAPIQESREFKAPTTFAEKFAQL